MIRDIVFIIKEHFKMDLCYFLNCFFIYSFLGYIFECAVLTFQTHTPVTDRGFVRSPLCTIYGVGAFGTLYLLVPLANNYFQLFFIGAAAATLLEIVTAKIMTKLFGYFWWDYKDRPFNYRGVICLESTVCWGAMTVCMVLLLHPLIVHIVDTYYHICGRPVAITLLVVYCIDFSTSFYKAIGDKHHICDCTSEEDEEMLAESIN